MEGFWGRGPARGAVGKGPPVSAGCFRGQEGGGCLWVGRGEARRGRPRPEAGWRAAGAAQRPLPRVLRASVCGTRDRGGRNSNCHCRSLTVC